MGDWLVGLCRPLAGWKLEISVEGYTIWPPFHVGNSKYTEHRDSKSQCFWTVIPWETASALDII